MDSFVLAETFKYLFLLFADKDELILNLDEFIFTTEGHLLPLSLSGHTWAPSMETYSLCRIVQATKIETVVLQRMLFVACFIFLCIVSNKSTKSHEYVINDDMAMSCPNTLSLFPESFRKPLQNMVDGMCPRRNQRRRLTAAEFSAANINHLKLIKEMGINILAMSDGRVQLLHTFSSARSATDAEEGLLFMQEMVELAKLQSQQPEPVAQAVTVPLKDHLGDEQIMVLQAGPSQFGRNLKGDEKVTAKAVIVHPFKGCEDLRVPDLVKDRIAIMERGDCMFIDKVRKVQKHGAVGAIIVDNVAGSSAASSPMFSMSGDGNNDVKIPAVFLFKEDASKLLLAISKDWSVQITISELREADNFSQNEEESMFQKLKLSVQDFLPKILHKRHKYKIKAIEEPYYKYTAEPVSENKIYKLYWYRGIIADKNIKIYRVFKGSKSYLDNGKGVHSITFTKTAVEVGGFRANIGTDKIRITYKETDTDNNLKEASTNQQWSKIRKGLLHSIMHSDSKELFVPSNILRIYYQTLSGASIEEVKTTDVAKQTTWLLSELVKEQKKKDDDLVKLDTEAEGKKHFKIILFFKSEYLIEVMTLLLRS
nr:unnamed protein product [Callosobruchus analis]